MRYMLVHGVEVGQGLMLDRSGDVYVMRRPTPGETPDYTYDGPRKARGGEWVEVVTAGSVRYARTWTQRIDEADLRLVRDALMRLSLTAEEHDQVTEGKLLRLAAEVVQQWDEYFNDQAVAEAERRAEGR